jgi:hypothetical protein
MFTSEQLRASAARFVDLSKSAQEPDAIRELQRQGRSFSDLADNEDWMAANSDKTVSSLDETAPPTTPDAPASPIANDGGGSVLADEERHILGCLGAAVLVRWNTLPTKLQKELFDSASSAGELLQTGALKGQIARFLHNHKDDEAAPGA